MSRHILRCAVATTLLLALPVFAAAPAPATEAAMVAKQAIDYYQNQQYALSAELYRRAYRIDPTKPEYLFGVARSEQKAGNMKAARLAFETLKGLLPVTDPFYLKCQKTLDEMDAAEKTARPPPPAVPPPQVIQAPPPVVETPKPLPPPSVVVVKPVEAPPKVVAVAPLPVVVQAPVDRTESKLLPWTLVAGGGALFLAGLGVSLSTLSDAAAWNRDSSSLGANGKIIGTNYETASATVTSLNTRLGVGIGLGVGGLACAGVGTWLLLRHPDKVALLPTPQGLLLTGRL